MTKGACGREITIGCTVRNQVGEAGVVRGFAEHKGFRYVDVLRMDGLAISWLPENIAVVAR